MNKTKLHIKTFKTFMIFVLSFGISFFVMLGLLKLIEIFPDESIFIFIIIITLLALYFEIYKHYKEQQ
jgi:uncharacterized membrane protein